MSKSYRQFVRQIQFVRNIRTGRSRMEAIPVKDD